MIGEFTQVLDRLIRSSNHPIIRLSVAVSGGSDSMALALLAQAAAFPVVALTVNHQLRPESQGEAERVSLWMAAQGIEHHILQWEHTEIKGNLQAAAREARYGLLTAYCRAHAIDTLLVGHTEDDQAETIALRQARDSGAVGLAGMSAISRKNDVTILRPLLAFRRQELREYLMRQQQPWIDDPSNEKLEFARIRIRKELSGDAERRESLLALGREMAKERRQIEQDYASFAACVQVTAPYQLQIPRDAWQKLTPAIALYALSRMLPAVSGRPYPPRYRELQALHRRMQVDAKATLGKCIITVKQDKVIISREGVESPPADAHINRGREKFPLAKPLVSLPFYSIQEAIVRDTVCE